MVIKLKNQKGYEKIANNNKVQIVVINIRNKKEEEIENNKKVQSQDLLRLKNMMKRDSIKIHLKLTVIF